MHCREKRRLPDLSGVRNEVRNGIFNPWISSVKQIHCVLSCVIPRPFIIFHHLSSSFIHQQWHRHHRHQQSDPVGFLLQFSIYSISIHFLCNLRTLCYLCYLCYELVTISYASFKLGFSKSNLQEKSIRKASEKTWKKYIPTGVRRDHELRSEICDRVPLNGGHVDKSQVEDCTAVPWCTVQCSERTPWHLTQLDRKKDCSCQLCRWNQCRDLSKNSNSKPFISQGIPGLMLRVFQVLQQQIELAVRCCEAGRRWQTWQTHALGLHRRFWSLLWRFDAVGPVLELRCEQLAGKGQEELEQPWTAMCRSVSQVI